jgi:hypothetical protein
MLPLMPLTASIADRRTPRRGRSALAVGLAGLILAGTIGSSGAATSRRHIRAEEAKKAHVQKTPKGPLLIVVSIGDQRVSLFGDGALVARSGVSTGMRGHPTPEGVFSVIQKDRYHRSNIYSAAPMPFMQRITWSGVALHAGVLPGYPASHGCIRLTYEFATMLWGMTQMGVRVIVARNAVEPVEIAHPALFVPRQNPGERPLAADRSADARPVAGPIKVAQSADATTASDATTTATPEPAAEARPAGGSPVEAPKKAEAPRPAGVPDVTGTVAAPAQPEAPKQADPAKQADAPAQADAPKREADAPVRVQTPSQAEAPKPPSAAEVAARAKAELASLTVADEPPRKREQFSVFISRKEARLFVRQGFMPLFSFPVTIRQPELPLGTHVFTAMGPKDGGPAMRWTVVTIPPQHAARAEERELTGRRASRKAREPAVVRHAPHETAASPTAAAALDRIDMPKEAVERISELMTTGGSLIVSDHPISDETNDGTDFIVLTR